MRLWEARKLGYRALRAARRPGSWDARMPKTGKGNKNLLTFFLLSLPASQLPSGAEGTSFPAYSFPAARSAKLPSIEKVPLEMKKRTT